MKFDHTELAHWDRDTFVANLGGVYEHSPWVAEAAWAWGPFDDWRALHDAMVRAVEAANEEHRLDLLNAHPDLAGKLVRESRLTEASTVEQASAGLDRLSEEEYNMFSALNAQYRLQFGFPFIICVKENDKEGILAAFRFRLMHSRKTEISEALTQVHRIARLRLATLFGGTP